MAGDNKKVSPLDAYNYYYALQGDRSYARVSKDLGISVATVSNWAKKYAWKRRVAEDDYCLALKLQRETDKQIIKDRKKYRDIIRACIIEYTENLKKGKVNIDKVSDLKLLMDTDFKLMDALYKGTDDELGTLVNLSGESLDTINRLSEELSNISEPPDIEEE